MINVKDKVSLIKEHDCVGYVVQVDHNLKDITTCRVVWGLDSLEDSLRSFNAFPDDSDIQWTNKLIKI